MQWQANPKTLEPRSFEIKHDPVVQSAFTFMFLSVGSAFETPFKIHSR